MNSRFLVLLAMGCVFGGDSAPPGSSSTPAVPAVTPSVDPDDYGYGSDTGLPFPAPDCTAPSPTSPSLACAMPVAANVVADCALGAHAAMWNGHGYATVPDALAAAAIGGVVQVCPGTWAGGFSIDRDLTLEAADPTPGATVIDGGGVRIQSASTIRGLTVRNGSRGEAAIAVATSGVVMECLTLEDNQGGAIVAGEGLTLRTSTFLRNTAPYDGGALSGSGTLLVEDSTFEGNTAGYGSGAVTWRGDLTFTRATFLENVADYGGGALGWGDWDPFVLTVNESLFHCNTAGYEGGAITAGTWADDDVFISGSTFSHNYADYEGGGLSLGSWGSVHLTLTDSTFDDNVAGHEGGAIELGGWAENGVFATLSGATFTDNRSEYGGGALSIGSRVPFGDLDGSGLVFLRNAASGGAVSLTANTTFDCTSCDMGSGADDNIPQDAEKGGQVYASLGADFSL